MTFQRKATIVSTAGIYVVLWVATYLAGALSLEWRLQEEVLDQWRADRPAQEKRSALFLGLNKTIAFEKGPSAKATLTLCPPPFVFIAEYSKVIGGLNGNGGYGVYFYTPWRVYPISEIETWIS